MITINRKDTYDIKLSKRRLHGAGRCAARAGPEAGGGEQSTGREDLSFGSGEQVERCGAHGAEDSQQADAGHDREARHQNPGPGNSGGRASRIYTGIQARAKERSLSANQLRRRLMDRGLRAPSGMSTKLQAASYKRQATSSKRSWIASHESRPGIQASSSKLQAARSGICVPS